METIADRYKIQEVLGTGASGTVYLCRDTRLGRLAAVKVLRPDRSDTAEDLLDEARRIAGIKALELCPYTAQVYDADVSATEGPYIAFQYIDGDHLISTLAKAGGSLPWAVAVRVAENIASALVETHKAEVIHRDIKPDNILIEDESEDAVLVDYGAGASLNAAVGIESLRGPFPTCHPGSSASRIGLTAAMTCTVWESYSMRC